MTVDEAYERAGWAQLGQTYVHHETAGLGDVLAPLVADALKDEAIAAELSLLVADTLRAPAVDSALNRIGLRLAAWTAGGIVVGLLAGYYLRRRV